MFKSSGTRLLYSDWRSAQLVKPGCGLPRDLYLVNVNIYRYDVEDVVSEYEDKADSSWYPHCLDSHHSVICLWWLQMSLVCGPSTCLIRMVILINWCCSIIPIFLL
uniref:Uncharacterized protein n=1 Tax=Davidia involucrata TaxID=16924 RepID=A0A5B6YFW3_DAVIN